MSSANENHGGVSVDEVREFWDANPVAAEGIDAEPGSAEFYKKFDAIRESDDCEPYDYSDLIHGYTTSEGLSVLDVGCGNGYVLSRYATNGAKVWGVDITPQAVELSKKRFELSDLEGEFQTTDGEGLPFADNSFDIVCSMGVLHHVENPRPMVSEIARVLKPGGKVIAMLYYRYSWKTIVIIRLKRLFHPDYRGKSQQEALNMNDGAECPLALVYSKGEARELFSAFERHTFRLNQLSWKQLFLIDRLARLLKPILPRSSDNFVARRLGWNLYIEAYAPNDETAKSS